MQHNYFEIHPYWICRLLLGLCCSSFILGKSLKPLQLKVRSMAQQHLYIPPAPQRVSNAEPHAPPLPLTQNPHFNKIPGHLHTRPSLRSPVFSSLDFCFFSPRLSVDCRRRELSELHSVNSFVWSSFVSFLLPLASLLLPSSRPHPS